MLKERTEREEERYLFISSNLSSWRWFASTTAGWHRTTSALESQENKPMDQTTTSALKTDSKIISCKPYSNRYYNAYIQAAYGISKAMHHRSIHS
jgi:hypothetical protein